MCYRIFQEMQDEEMKKVIIIPIKNIENNQPFIAKISFYYFLTVPIVLLDNKTTTIIDRQFLIWTTADIEFC